MGALSQLTSYPVCVHKPLTSTVRSEDVQGELPALQEMTTLHTPGQVTRERHGLRMAPQDQNFSRTVGELEISEMSSDTDGHGETEKTRRRRERERERERVGPGKGRNVLCGRTGAELGVSHLPP